MEPYDVIVNQPVVIDNVRIDDIIIFPYPVDTRKAISDSNSSCRAPE